MTPDIKLPENPDRLRHLVRSPMLQRWWLAVLAAAPFAIAIGSLGGVSADTAVADCFQRGYPASAVLGRRAEFGWRQSGGTRVDGAGLGDQCLSESGSHVDGYRTAARSLPRYQSRLMHVGVRSGITLLFASLATVFATVISPVTALADQCAPGLTMDQSGACVPATIEENLALPPEWVTGLGWRCGRPGFAHLGLPELTSLPGGQIAPFERL